MPVGNWRTDLNEIMACKFPCAGCLVCSGDGDDPSHRRHRGVLLNNCLFNGVCLHTCQEYESEIQVPEYEWEIFIRPNYETHATHFIPLTYET